MPARILNLLSISEANDETEDWRLRGGKRCGDCTSPEATPVRKMKLPADWADMGLWLPGVRGRDDEVGR